MSFGCQRLLILTLLFSSGCVWNYPAPVAQRPASFGWDSQADLTLDQIPGASKLKAPATQPSGRPLVESLALYAQARDATLRGQPSVAIAALQKAIALDPFRFQLRYDLGWAYVNANTTDDSAISAFEKAAILGPDHLELQTELGRLYLAKGNPAAAIEHLRLATKTTEYSTDDGRAAIADFFSG